MNSLLNYLSSAARRIFEEEELASSRFLNLVRYATVLLAAGPLFYIAANTEAKYALLINSGALSLYMVFTIIHSGVLYRKSIRWIRRFNVFAMLVDMFLTIAIIVIWGMLLSPDNLSFMAKMPLWNFILLVILSTVFQFNHRVTYAALGLFLLFHFSVSGFMLYQGVEVTNDRVQYVNGPKIDIADLIFLKPVLYILMTLIVVFTIKKTIRLIRRATEAEAEKAVVEKELEMARSIQQSNLPVKVRFPAGTAVYSIHEPMIQVGGDYYDYYLNDNEIGILVCDVSGHGMPAALIVSMLHLLFHSEKKAGINPEKLLSNMNSVLYGNIESQFVTASYISYSISEKLLTVTNGGHPPVLVYRKQAYEVVSYRPFGRPLGLFENIVYGHESVQLEAGDRVLVYTDGIIEAENADGAMLSHSGLAEYFRSHATMEAHEFLPGLRNFISEWTDSKVLEDDIAAVMLEVQ